MQGGRGPSRDRSAAMDWGVFFRATATIVLAIAPPVFHFVAPSVPGWADTVETATVYSYLAGGLAAGALVLLILGVQRDSTGLKAAAVSVSLPVLPFSALATGIIIEYDVDTAARYLRAEAADIANWAFLVVGLGSIVVATTTVAHWETPTDARSDRKNIVSTSLAVIQFGTTVAAAIEAGNGKLDDVATGVAIGAAIAAAGSLALIVWMMGDIARGGGPARVALVGIETLQATLVGIAAGYLYQLGSASAGTGAETVGWILVAALAVKAVQWSVFHWNPEGR